VIVVAKFSVLVDIHLLDGSVVRETVLVTSSDALTAQFEARKIVKQRQGVERVQVVTAAVKVAD
jgi:hypothetical protein